MPTPEPHPPVAPHSGSPHAGSPHLAPGLRVVRRGLHHLQVGLHDGRRALLPHTEDVQRALTLLLERRVSAARIETDPQLAEVLDRLERGGCLVWEPEHTRTPAAVAVLGDVPVPGLPDLGELFAATGIATTASVHQAEVVVLVSRGELDRGQLDPLVRSGQPHVVLRLVDGGAVLGPFVVPGRTPCLRCIDAHLCVRDPDHVAVTARYVRASALPRADGVPDLDAPLVSLARSWTVRDVAAHLGGRAPSTWSRTITLGADPDRRQEQEWQRHPGCGCCWPVDSLASGTMGA